jgi:release factor glutamine methyltransferase
MASAEPLQYVLQEAWFYGRKFNVSPDVLIPRPETELLCRTVIDSPAGVDIQDMPPPARGCPSLRGRGSGISIPYGHTPRILDLCTGSGCIAWTLALEIPGSDVVAVDISDGALKVADGQDFSEELSSTGARRPQFFKADVLAQPLTSLGQFDIIVSNPPYVMESEKALMRANVLDHEPHLALFVSDDDPLLFYRAVAKWALLMLRPGGYGIVEINEALAFDTEEVFLDLGFRNVRTIKDLHDRDRFVEFYK